MIYEEAKNQAHPIPCIVAFCSGICHSSSRAGLCGRGITTRLEVWHCGSLELRHIPK